MPLLLTQTDNKCIHLGGVSVPAISILPSPSVDIFSPAKQASKQSDPLSGALLFVHRRRRLDGFGWRFLDRKLRYRNAVNCQKPPQASILFAETNILLLWGFEWKRV
jgi:hypothetical protein